MNVDEFVIYIKSLGFEYKGDFYQYKNHNIYVFDEKYGFYNGAEWSGYIDFNDLTPIQKDFKKELRSIKLKHLLG